MENKVEMSQTNLKHRPQGTASAPMGIKDLASQGPASLQIEFTKMTSSAEGEWLVSDPRPQWVLTDNTFACISKQRG